MLDSELSLDPLERNFILQVWNKDGRLVWTKGVKNRVKAAHMSHNYDKLRYKDLEHTHTFIFVLDDGLDEI